jgi:N-acyl-D-amino-acid deacylase
MLDILIRNGWVADGTGNPTYPADVAIEGERIVDVGRLEGAEAEQVIDASGKIVCPGFVDSHSHNDWSILANPTEQSSIRQGTTTDIVGNCGYSMAPINDLSREFVAARMEIFGYTGPYNWSSYSEFLDVISQTGTSGNLVWLAGHNTIRTAAGVIGSDATEEQLRTMEDFVREAMEAGALGLSTGLEFEPGRNAPTEEVVRLAKVAGEYGGYYVTHMRNRAQYIEESTQEFLDIVRQSGTIGEISHLNVRHNTAPEGAWDRSVGMMEQAREEGLNVMADTTPFLDGLGQMAGILPPWVKAEGPARTAELLRDPAVRERLRTDCDRYWRFIHRGDWHRIRVLKNRWFPELAGMNFSEVAELWGKDEWDCYFDILAEAGAEMDSLNIIGLLFTEEHSAAMVRHPLFNLAVDGMSSVVSESSENPMAHPINYAGMVHYFTYHVREKHTLRLEEAIRKMTSMPATHHGLRDRGLIRRGYFADVVVFDFEALDDVSTVEQPVAYVRGVEHVLVNGVPVVEDGEHNGARPGRNLSYG